VTRKPSRHRATTTTRTGRRRQLRARARARRIAHHTLAGGNQCSSPQNPRPGSYAALLAWGRAASNLAIDDALVWKVALDHQRGGRRSLARPPRFSVAGGARACIAGCASHNCGAAVLIASRDRHQKTATGSGRSQPSTRPRAASRPCLGSAATIIATAGSPHNHALGPRATGCGARTRMIRVAPEWGSSLLDRIGRVLANWGMLLAVALVVGGGEDRLARGTRAPPPRRLIARNAAPARAARAALGEARIVFGYRCMRPRR